MKESHPLNRLAVIWLLAVGLVWTVEPATSSAQEMKRDAGTMSRSAGSTTRGVSNRQGNSLGEDRRGAATSMKSERTPTSSKDDQWDDKKKSKDDEKDSSASQFGHKQSDDEEEEQDFDGRTLGRAYMYGGDGEVLYRPEGSICRGDPPRESRRKKRAAPTREPLHMESSAAPPAAAEAPLLPDMSTSAPNPRHRMRPAKRPRVRKAHPAVGKPQVCIFAKDGSLLHAPSGVDCGA